MRSSFPDGCFRNHHPRDLVVAWFPSCLVLFSVSDLRVTTVSPPASFDASTTNFVRFPIVMTPLLSLICLQDITPHIYFSQKPMSLISLTVPPIILADLDVLVLPVVLPLDVGQ